MKYSAFYHVAVGLYFNCGLQVENEQNTWIFNVCPLCSFCRFVFTAHRWRHQLPIQLIFIYSINIILLFTLPFLSSFQWKKYYTPIIHYIIYIPSR